jgi:hypothetical protein
VAEKLSCLQKVLKWHWCSVAVEFVKWVDNGHNVQVCSNAQRRVSRFIPDYKFVLGVGAVCKNRDEHIYFIDRVS